VLRVAELSTDVFFDVKHDHLVVLIVLLFLVNEYDEVNHVLIGGLVSRKSHVHITIIAFSTSASIANVFLAITGHLLELKVFDL